MWLFTFFDLPVTTRNQRKLATRFRNTLLRLGCTMLQYSIYAIYCTSEEAAESKRRLIRSELPPEGQVRLMAVTDHQFGKMEAFIGETPTPPEQAPRQLEFF